MNPGRKLEETKRVARILQIVQLIAAAPQRYTRKDIAAHFEISVETVKKDLEVIRHGMRLRLESTRGHGYYFVEIPHLPALTLQLPQALALLTAIQGAQQVLGTGSAELAAAVAHLESLFPAEFQGYLQAAVRTPMLTAQREHRQELLTLLNRALLVQNKIEITYETRSRGGSISDRIVHPYHIFPYVRSWQLVAWCEKRENIIMFKVDRIHKARLIPQTHYRVSDHFDIDAYIGNVWGVMRGVAKEPEDIVLHFDADAGGWVKEEFWHKSQQVEEQEDGGIIFRLHLVITPEFVNWLLYYGERVKVVEPKDLRKMVIERLRKAVSQYSDDE